MSESRSHKTTANRIAEKYNVKYNNGKGVDVKATQATVEIETSETVTDALSQLRGHRGRVYIAGTNMDAVEKALEATEGTTVGVIDNQGKIVKRSTRK